MYSRSVIVDNADTQITYSPGWKEDGSPNEYKRTTTNAVIEGASFSLNFTGTSITVYGTLNTDSSPNSTYVLDGGEPFPFASNQASSVRYQQIFYASPAVPYKEHTLVGTCVSGRVILDYFVIETPFDSPHTPLPKPEEPDSPFNQRVPAVPTAAIIGGVLGGLVFLIALLAFYLWYRGYRASNNSRLKSSALVEANTPHSAPAGFPNARLAPTYESALRRPTTSLSTFDPGNILTHSSEPDLLRWTD
ncbi:hypothetical protein AB1N83_004079 [Pleurotus pulmonarius]